MINKEKAVQMLVNNIQVKFKHQDYDRVKEYAEFLLKAVTGIGLDSELKRFVPRETDEMFKQRCEITNHITKPVLAQIRRPKQKISRITPIVKEIKYGKEKQEDKVDQLKKILDEFYGGQSLDAVLGGRVNDLQDIDPNAFMLILFKDFDHRYNKPIPYFHEVSCEQAVDFQFINDVLQYLIVCSDIQYVEKDGDNEAYKDGKEYIIYVDNDSVKATQVCAKDYNSLEIGKMTTLPIVNPTEDQLDDDKTPKSADFYKFDEQRVFMFTYYTQKSGMVPAFRVGYALDPQTKGRTCISFLDPAIPYIRKTIKTVSEFDMGMTMHAFLQKVVYTPPCPGHGNEICIGGYTGNGEKCKTCDGTGKRKVVTTTQDVIEVTLPEPDKIEKAFDLSKMVYYVTLPIDILKFESENIIQLGNDCTRACYNTNVYTQNSTVSTATEKLLDYESVYDTLYPAGVKYSSNYILSTTVIANYNDLGKDLVVKHQYGKDLKFKTMEVLLESLKGANDAKAPAFVRQSINNDLAIILYADRPEDLMRYNGMKRFDPFEGKTMEEIQFLITNKKVTNYSITLYSESKRIFQELEDEASNPTDSSKPVFFWALDLKEQKKRVDKKVEDIQAELEEDQPVVTPFPTGDPGAGDGNEPPGGAPPKPGNDPGGNPKPNDTGGE